MQPVDTSYLASLKIEGGVIRTRGKYFAEMRYVPHFHARCGSGHYNYYQRDPDDNLWHVCQVTEAEREAFPELLHVTSVGIFVERGKVCSWTRSCLYAKR